MTSPDLAPPRIRRLGRDARGRYVPWFATRPVDFQRVTALKNNLCWTCGDALSREKVFVLSPGMAIVGTAWEPPSHLDCAHYAVTSFMKNRLGITVVWVCRAYEVFLPKDPENHAPVIAIGEPIATEFWTRGRRATRAEIDENVRIGMKAIEPLVREDPDPVSAFAALGRRQRAFEALLPES